MQNARTNSKTYGMKIARRSNDQRDFKLKEGTATEVVAQDRSYLKKQGFPRLFNPQGDLKQCTDTAVALPRRRNPCGNWRSASGLSETWRMENILRRNIEILLRNCGAPKRARDNGLVDSRLQDHLPAGFAGCRGSGSGETSWRDRRL